MRSKKIVSTLAALSLAVSCFVGFASGVSAATDVIDTDFEDQTAIFSDISRMKGVSVIQSSVGENTTYVQQIGGNTGGGALAGAAISIESPEIVTVEFDYAMDARHSQVSLRGNQPTTNNARNFDNTSRFFRIGSNNGSSGIVFSDANANTVVAEPGTWVHVKTVLNFVSKTMDNDVYTYSTSGTYTGNGDLYTADNVAFLDTNLTSIWGFDCYDVTNNSSNSYMDNLKITTDVSADPVANYSIKYQLSNGTEIKTVPGKTGAVGEAPTLLDSDKASFVEKDVKYIYVSDNASALSVASDDSTVVTVTVRAAETYSIVVNMVDSNEAPIGSLDTVTAWEGDSVKVAYPRYVIANDSLYFKDASSNEYNYSFTASSNDPIAIEYALQDSKPVYYQEGETIFTNNNVSNANIRCSMGAGGDVSESTTITTLQPGTYKISTAVWGGGRNEGQNSTYTFTLGSDSFEAQTTGSWTRGEGVITINEAADLTVAKTTVGTRGACIDYVLIEELEPSVTAVTSLTGVTGPSWGDAEKFQVYESNTFNDVTNPDLGSGHQTTLYIKAENFTPKTTPIVTLADGTKCQSHKTVVELGTEIGGETYFIYQFYNSDTWTEFDSIEIDGIQPVR